ncbi:hypothetical protein CR51_16935 [Caballeronia megalochromosomata]|nr:hypothetical protein CR51_16935 [Caballeronia megalochromosomata]
MLIDGYDQVAAAFAAPALMHAWHTNAAGFGRVFGVGLFGVLVGSLLLGLSDDRFIAASRSTAARSGSAF